jgi:hypothetical protein
LAIETFRGNAREDRALYDTMKAIHDRLAWNLVVDHPVTPRETITKGADDPKARFLRERLKEALDSLTPLFDADCTRKKALKCWDKVFATSYFSDRNEPKAQDSAKLLKVASVAPPAAALTFPNAPRVDNKPRGFG